MLGIITSRDFTFIFMESKNFQQSKTNKYDKYLNKINVKKKEKKQQKKNLHADLRQLVVD